MTIYNILHYPDPRLHTIAKPVALGSEGVSTQTRTLIDGMFETMRQAKGIGLAATQINVHERLVVIDVSEEGNEPLVLINPEIIWASPDKQKNDEGCLSVPGIFDGVERSVAVKVKTRTVDGGEQIIEAEDLLAICIQHEMDHLMGKVFVEYLSPLKRNRIKTKLLKEAREAAKD
jgi:peptide deformylase